MPNVWEMLFETFDESELQFMNLFHVQPKNQMP